MELNEASIFPQIDEMVAKYNCLHDKDEDVVYENGIFVKSLVRTTEDIFERCNNGTGAVVASDKLGSQMRRQFPHIFKSKAPDYYFPASMKMSPDFSFKDIFTRM